MNLEQLLRSSSAVLFDFDGVLADSEPFYRKSWNLVLASYNHCVSEGNYWKHWAFLGEGLEGEMKRTGLVVPFPHSEKAKQKAIYRNFCLSGTIPLFPLAERAVHAVMMKMPCAIASNTPMDLVRAVAEKKIRNLPPVTGGEHLQAKPAPDIFLRAAEGLGIEPSECVVFEDAMKGIKAGLAAGMKVVLVRNRYNRGFDGSGAACETEGLEEIISTMENL